VTDVFEYFSNFVKQFDECCEKLRKKRAAEQVKKKAGPKAPRNSLSKTTGSQRNSLSSKTPARRGGIRRMSSRRKSMPTQM